MELDDSTKLKSPLIQSPGFRGSVLENSDAITPFDLDDPEPSGCRRCLGACCSKGVLVIAAAVFCMACVANFQFAFTIMAPKFEEKFGCTEKEVQLAFSLFIIFETWVMPFTGLIADKFGPAVLAVPGGFIAGGAWVVCGFAPNLWVFQACQAVCGAGVGAIYGACIGVGSKWFPARRGLVVGLIALGFGAGTLVTIKPLKQHIDERGVESMVVWWGAAQGLLVMIVGFFLRLPKRVPAVNKEVVEEVIRRMSNADEQEIPLDVDDEGEKEAPTVEMLQVNMTPLQMLCSPSFWVMYLMFILMASTGLLVTSNLSNIANANGIGKTKVFGSTAVVVAVQCERVFFGISKPAYGMLSDFIGRENTMFLAFGLQAVLIVFWIFMLDNALAFALLTGIAFSGYGEIFSLFPSLTTDLFGRQYATSNYGILYTAKGVASLIGGPLASICKEQLGSWDLVLWYSCGASAATCLITIFLLKPLANIHRRELTKKATQQQNAADELLPRL